MHATGQYTQEGGATTAGRRALTWPYLLVTTKSLGHGPYVSYQTLRQPVMRSAAPADTGKASQRPVILAGGFASQQISEATGGAAQLLLLVRDPQGLDDVATVEVFIEGNLLATIGPATQEPALDMVVFEYELAVDAQTPAGRYLVEAVAIDQAGNRSTLWPYLTVEPSGTGGTEIPGQGGAGGSGATGPSNPLGGNGGTVGGGGFGYWPAASEPQADASGCVCVQRGSRSGSSSAGWLLIALMAAVMARLRWARSLDLGVGLQ